MKIKTLFFGITTDLVGASQLQIDVEKNTTIGVFKNLLKNDFSQLENINSYAIAVNEEYASDEIKISVPGKKSEILSLINTQY